MDNSWTFVFFSEERHRKTANFSYDDFYKLPRRGITLNNPTRKGSTTKGSEPFRVGGKLSKYTTRVSKRRYQMWIYRFILIKRMLRRSMKGE